MDFYNLVCTKAETTAFKYRQYRIPKLKDKLERMIGYADNLEALAQKARQGDEQAMEDLITLGFSEKEL